jgi:hypothetical protein
MLTNEKKVLSKILRGASSVFYKNKCVFIKHLTYLDSIDSDFLYEEKLHSNINSGVLTEQNKLDFLISKGFWSKDKDEKIEQIRNETIALKNKKNLLVLPSKVKTLESEINEKELSFYELLAEKHSLLGNTAENLAKQYADDIIIVRSFFSDHKLSQNLFDLNIDDLDFLECENIKSVYKNSLLEFSQEAIKKIAISPYFNELSFIANGDFNILGKPISEYTFFQLDLFSYAKIYKRILESEPQPPVEIRSSPEKLESWFDANNRKSKLNVNKNNDSAGSAIVGATPEDIKEIFKDEPGAVNLSQEIKKNPKKRMSMADLIKLHK